MYRSERSNNGDYRHMKNICGVDDERMMSEGYIFEKAIMVGRNMYIIEW